MKNTNREHIPKYMVMETTISEKVAQQNFTTVMTREVRNEVDHV